MRETRRCIMGAMVVVVAALVLAGCSKSQPGQPTSTDKQQPATASPDRSGVQKAASAQDAINRGIAFLTAHQTEDGAFQVQKADLPIEIGVTGLVVKALADSPTPLSQADKARTDKAVQFLLANQQDDGGIRGDQLGTYTTSIAIVALEAMQNPKYKDNIDRAVAYVKTQQCSSATGTDAYKNGGFGYGANPRPDLSNTQTALDAFQAAGLAKDDPAYKQVVIFLSRCQNNSETNDQEYAEGQNDGGGVYSPTSSAAGEYKKPNGDKALRSYGSMTYALLKSMIYANLSKDDPKVVAAMGWIKKNYTLDENPGMEKSQSGLYYYFQTFAKALSAYGQDTVTDDKGVAHDWRKDLTAKLISLQKPDGSWVNTADRWYEADPELVTAYAVLSLEQAQEKP